MLLNELETYEKAFELDQVNHQILFELGSLMAQRAINEKLPVSMVIYLGEQCVFFYAADGSSLNTESWVKRKRRAVQFFGHSTAWLNEKVKGESSLLETKYGLKPGETVAVQGGFPIILKGFRVVGAIAVSGLSAQEDEDLITGALRVIQEKYAKKY